MTSSTNDPPLEHEHSPQEIRKRLISNNEHHSLGDFVLGAVDGTVTTFAIVAGVAGAELSAGIALVLGLANVLADGFSMAVSNYLKSRSDAQVVEQYRRIEEKHIEVTPEGEREEIRQIFAAKGFKGDILEEIVNVIASDRRRWVDTMLVEEWGLPLQQSSPTRAALVTFTAFVLAGSIPLLPLCLSGTISGNLTFQLSTLGALLTFIFVGAIRGKVTNQSMLASASSTLFMGAAAAGLSFLVGMFLRQLTGLG
ncbi:VIT1/CCC1 transporter family protein [Calycomorphotria hydatis]|nr:VIT1/CCC1 transporter family protein [Calycomorphotria hydatis]